jgi:ubiquinol-cytochrome c reductase iron-sulfur subunit
MNPSKDVEALATIEVDISGLSEGQSKTVLWRGKPLFIKHRSQNEIDEAKSVNIEELPHPEKDDERVKNPKYLVLIGVCTHLGCVPASDKGDFKGWFCPCHGSHYDTSGRIRKGPAPTNLEIPPYTFKDNNTILIG